MSDLLIITQNYIIGKTNAFITGVGFPEVVYDADGIASLANPRNSIEPSYKGALEVTQTFSESPSRRDKVVRLPDQWVWQLRLDFERMVSLEEFKEFVSIDFRVPRDYQSGSNPAIFLYLEEVLMEHPVEVQGSAAGTKARFQFRGWLRPV